MPGPYVVTSVDTAAAVGSGDVPVLATPQVIAWLEAATVAACDDLPPGSTTVGTRVDVEHLIATPLGAAVATEAQIVHRDDRLLRFEVTAFHDVGDGPVLVAHGHITRVVVDRDRFLARATRPLIIRTAVPAEWQEVGELVVDAYRAGYGLSGNEDSYVDVLRDVSTRASHSDVLVAVEGDQVVGSVTVIEPGTPCAEISRPGEREFRFMAVRPDRWGRGIARALVEAVIARSGDLPVVCCVIQGNDPAFGLYEACGFERVPERDWQPVPDVQLRAFVRSPGRGVD